LKEEQKKEAFLLRFSSDEGNGEKQKKEKTGCWEKLKGFSGT